MLHLKYIGIVVLIFISLSSSNAQRVQFGLRFLTSDFNKTISINPNAEGQSFPSGIGIHLGLPYTDYFLLGVDSRLGLVKRANNEFLDAENGDFFFTLSSFARIQNLKPQKVWKPYIQAGLGLLTFEKTTQWKPAILLGVGLDIEVQKGVLFGLGTNFTRELRRHRYFIEYHLGVTLKIGRDKSIESELQEIIVEKEIDDQDSDGIPDASDGCPLIAGPLSTAGCPDKDEDGIADRDDACPDQPGMIGNGGCPMANSDVAVNQSREQKEDKNENVIGLSGVDTDGDGIPDRLDQCPEMYGNEDNNGCPKPDRDNDGVSDEKDLCPDLPGSIYWNGCPEEIAKQRGNKPNQSVEDTSIISVKEEVADVVVQEEKEVKKVEKEVIEEAEKTDKIKEIVEANPVDTNIEKTEDLATEPNSDDIVVEEKVEKPEIVELITDDEPIKIEVEESDSLKEVVLAEETTKATQTADSSKSNKVSERESSIEKREIQTKDKAETSQVVERKVNKESTPESTTVRPVTENTKPSTAPVTSKVLDAPEVRIHFTSGHAALQKKYIDELEVVANYMRMNPEVNLKIYGHTDSKGSAWVNEILSRRRAEACHTFLTLAAKINPARISYHGEGEYQPLSDNLTPEGRFINRRVVFDFLR